MSRSLSTLLPDPAAVQLLSMTCEAALITMDLAPVCARGHCPLCQQPSTHVHSWYRRTLADLPWQGVAVLCRLRVRRFFCDNRACAWGIFTERLPQVVSSYGRQTCRLTTLVRQVGCAVGGEAGRRLLHQMGILLSGDTILTQVGRMPTPTHPTPRILSVDDWADARGRRYGSILVDLERHCVIDLLPDRTSATFAAWLRQHPGVEVISRDRGGPYADGARQGAPHAQQVADRFHVLRNAQEALERVISRYATQLAQVAHHLAASADAGQQATPMTTTTVPSPPVATIGPAESPETPEDPVKTPPEGRTDPAPSAAPPPPAPTRPATRRAHRQEDIRARRQARRVLIRTLAAQDVSQREIAARLGIARQTVARDLEAASVVVPRQVRRAPHPRLIAPYESYLRARWTEGCRNAHLLWQEIVAQGYAGCASTVRQCLAAWRCTPRRSPCAPCPEDPALRGGSDDEQVRDSGDPVDLPDPLRTPRPPRPQVTALSPRQATWLLLQNPQTWTAPEAAYCTLLCHSCPEIATAQELIVRFFHIVRTRAATALSAWTEEVQQSHITGLVGFATGLHRDWSAVQAALTLEWSQGQIEGQINRLKMIKRRFYGQASFALLRQCVLVA